jgi:hypothetical protein
MFLIFCITKLTVLFHIHDIPSLIFVWRLAIFFKIFMVFVSCYRKMLIQYLKGLDHFLSCHSEIHQS